MSIVLESPEYRITEIKRKTKARVFEDFEVGDLIHFRTTLKNTTNWGRGNYASKVVTLNTTKGTAVVKTQSNLLSVLDAFELEEVSE